MNKKTVFIILGIVGFIVVCCGVLSVAGLIFAIPNIRNAALRAQRVNELKAIGLSYHTFNDKYKRGPANANDLREFCEFPDAMRDLENGTFVFNYNVSLREITEGGGATSNTILAYDRDTPSKGGPVLFADGAARLVTADEFRAFPQAQRKK